MMAGMPYRWELPKAATNQMVDLANMMGDMRFMHKVFVTYTSLQSVLMMMLLARLVHHMSFQPKVGIIAKTLTRVGARLFMINMCEV